MSGGKTVRKSHEKGGNHAAKEKHTTPIHPPNQEQTSTMKMVAEEKLAELGILQLQRVKLPVEPGLGTVADVQFHFAPCRKNDTKPEQNAAAMHLLRSLGNADCEVWSDGSVGEPQEQPAQRQTWRVAVKWDDGWFTGTARQGAQIQSARPYDTFLARRDKAPDLLIEYDDGYNMCYTVNSDETITDSNAHTLKEKFLKIDKVDAGGFAIFWNDRNEPQAGTVPTGVGVCSYTAEIAAVRRALSEVSIRTCFGWRGLVRLVTDSKSVVHGLQKSARRQTRHLQEVTELLTMIGNLCPVQVVWVPGHCGIDRNETADKLAKSGLSIPLADQEKVPLDFLEVQQRLKLHLVTQPPVQNVPESLEEDATLWAAQTALSQVFVGHATGLHPVSTYLLRRKSYWPLELRHRIENTVDHFVMRCRKRSKSRRDTFPSARERQGVGVSEIVKKWPERLLDFLWREGFIKKSTYHAVGISGVRP